MSTIVLNALNYLGTGILNGVSYFWEKTGGIVNAFSPLTAKINITQDRSNVLWKLVVPVVVAADSPCGCAGEVEKSTIVDLTFRFDRRATVAERDEVYKRVKDLVAHASFKASITDLTLPT